MNPTILNWIYVSLFLSFASVISTAVVFMGVNIYHLIKKDRLNKRNGVRKYIPGLIALVIFALLTERFALELYLCSTPPGNSLTVGEAVARSIVETLLVVGTYENYAEYIVLGRQMMEQLFGIRFMVVAYDIHTSLLTVIAPILGYAVVLDVLTKVFPKLRYKLTMFRRHFYFSELNERSVALAESIVNENFKGFNRPLFVFTDSYVDDDNEKSAELLLKAKALGAVCLSDDILHLTPSPTVWEKYYFLMDLEEMNNLETLAALVTPKDFLKLKRTHIYVFYQNDSYEYTERKLVGKLEESLGKLRVKEVEKEKEKIAKEIQYEIDKTEANFLLDEKTRNEQLSKLKKRNAEKEAIDIFMPTIKRVRYYENLILSLLEDIPLVTPVKDVVVHKDRERDFNLTIFGNGEIGTQMLISSTWCGQFYGYRFCVNVVSKDSEDDAIGKINRINPDILESSKKDSPMLKVFPNEDNIEYSDPYFTFRYACADIKKSDIEKITATNPYNRNDTHNIADSDYYFISMGSDELNIATAEQLRKKILINHSNNNIRKKVVIVMVVFNQSIRDLFDNEQQDDSDVYIYSFGSLQEAYSWQNVTMKRLDPYARYLNAHYEAISISQARHEIRAKRENSYGYWSTIARRIHYKYKVFSLYHYVNSPENQKNLNWDIDSFREYNRLVKEYTEIAEKEENSGPDAFAYLTWLEHRRWNAYLRSAGYTLGVKKDVDLKTHTCLVECKKEPEQKEHPFSYKLADCLDMVGDYKKYDRPAVEVEYIFENQACQRMGISKSQLDYLCKNNFIPGSIKMKERNQWLIPVSYAKEKVDFRKIKKQFKKGRNDNVQTKTN